MTLRRCDSLPTRLRDSAGPAGSEPRPCHTNSPDTTTAPNFNEPPDREQILATWKSLHTDVKKIKNGFLTKSEPPNRTNKRGSIKHKFISGYACKNRDVRRKVTYENRQTGAGQEVDRSSSFPLDPGQSNTAERGVARKKTLLQRLLSWRTPECDCREKYMPKSRPEPRLTAEDLLCTCGASAVRFKPPEKSSQFAERGRSKSVGYEAAREVTQFRRCASAGATVGAETAAALRARAALTLARRYYPEGGWGWTITVVGTIVQILSHGLQLGGGTGAIACAAAVKFRVPPLYTHGSGKPIEERRTLSEERRNIIEERRYHRIEERRNLIEERRNLIERRKKSSSGVQDFPGPRYPGYSPAHNVSSQPAQVYVQSTACIASPSRSQPSARFKNDDKTKQVI
ncbi:hypothetical protein NE865_01882 [Phthorimaea operculella]|nr:hypothetical protein NE865_01882 [Phthorimaea operculella]